MQGFRDSRVEGCGFRASIRKLRFPTIMMIASIISMITTITSLFALGVLRFRVLGFGFVGLMAHLSLWFD